MAQTTVEGVEGVLGLVGQHLGYSEWVEITQEQVNQFADATGDHQWIHVDPARARSGPFGATIAHGLFTLSLAPAFVYELLDIGSVSSGVNYGYDKVRFPAPLPTGSRVRLRLSLTDAAEVPGGHQLALTQTFDAEGQDKPVCVAHSLLRVYP